MDVPALAMSGLVPLSKLEDDFYVFDAQRNHLVDHVNLFYAPLFAGDDGIPVVQGLSVRNRDEAIHLAKIKYKRLGDDLMIEGDVSYQT